MDGGKIFASCRYLQNILIVENTQISRRVQKQARKHILCWNFQNSRMKLVLQFERDVFSAIGCYTSFFQWAAHPHPLLASHWNILSKLASKYQLRQKQIIETIHPNYWKLFWRQDFSISRPSLPSKALSTKATIFHIQFHNPSRLF